jgi:hypothetical protein
MLRLRYYRNSASIFAFEGSREHEWVCLLFGVFDGLFPPGHAIGFLLVDAALLLVVLDDDAGCRGIDVEPTSCLGDLLVLLYHHCDQLLAL